MIIVEEYGTSVMLTGVVQKDIDEFFSYMGKNTSYGALMSYLKFSVPKGNEKVDIFVIECTDSRDGRCEIQDYWTKKGQKFDEDNISLLRL